MQGLIFLAQEGMPITEPVVMPGSLRVPTPKSLFTPDEHRSLDLVYQCWGSTSCEAMDFVKFLVTQVHGKPWIEDLNSGWGESDPDLVDAAGVEPVDLARLDTSLSRPCGEQGPCICSGGGVAEVGVPQRAPQHLPGPAVGHVNGDVVEIAAHAPAPLNQHSIAPEGEG